MVRGKWVLVGLRDWEVVKEDKEKCDLLEVYSDYNKEMLIKNTSVDFEPFILMFNDEENTDNINLEFNNSADTEDISEVGEHQNTAQLDFVFTDEEEVSESEEDVSGSAWLDYDAKTTGELPTENIKTITDQFECIDVDDI